MHPFFYPLKISENRKVFQCFQGVQKGCIGNKWFIDKFKHKFTFNKFKQTLAAFKEDPSGKSNQVAFFGTGKAQSPDLRSGLFSMFLA